MDVMLDPTDFLLEWPDEPLLSQHELWHQVPEVTLRHSRHDLRALQRLAERGDGAVRLHRSPRLRK